jgi:hypothetical protein
VAAKIRSYMEHGVDELGRKIVSCTFCGFTSRYSTNLRSHIEGKHTEGLVYTCVYCSYQVNTWQTLQSHVKRIHGESASKKADLSDFRF